MSLFDGTAAVLMAVRYCRQYPLFQWKEDAPLPTIGRRPEKYSFRVDLANLQRDACAEVIMMLFPASQSFLDLTKDSVAYKLKALLVTIKHPYILPTMEFHYTKEKKAVLVVQPFVAQGSLKDRIHRSCPTRPYDEKYRLYRASPLDYREIARFGRQILEALQALRSRGILCDHLSSANVLIDQGNARLGDLFTPLLAIDRHRSMRELTVGLEDSVDLDVLLFGHVLYEMSTGLELLTPTPESGVLEYLRPEIAEVLRLIFTPSPKASSKVSSGDEAASPLDVAVEDDTTSISSDGSASSGCFNLDLEDLLSQKLFAEASVPPIRSLFAGFRLDSAMKSTIRHSMRINVSRNHAYVVHHKEKIALARARQRAERRVHEEREKQEKRAQQLTIARSMNTVPAGGTGKSVTTRRKSYRAGSFRAPLERQASGASEASAA